MSPKSIRQDCSKASPSTLHVDRISNLPSCLIVKIISLLPTEDAVATSALSRKWKKIWTSVTSLDFSDKRKAPKGFEKFVYRVLLLHDKLCLQSFSLRCSRIYDGSVVNAWIASILISKVKELIISFPKGQPIWLPSELFLCRSLVCLKLVATGGVEIPTSICLPSLKTLDLDDIILFDNASIASLVSGCPLLEELRLGVGIGKNVLLPSELFLCKSLVCLDLVARESVEISTYICLPSLKTLDPTSICLPSLKTLNLYKIILSDNASIPSLLSGCPLLEEISLGVYIGENVGVIHIVALTLISLTLRLEPGPVDDYQYFSDYKYQVIIDTPALKYLNLDDYEAPSYVLNNLNHLVEAEVSFWNPGGTELFYPKAITDFFGAISHIQSLSLDHFIREAIVESWVVLPTFSNLTFLRLENARMSDLFVLLENFPQLQTLHLQGVFDEVDEFDDEDEPPSCFHFKTLILDYIGLSKSETKMIEYFLWHAKVLEKLAIVLNESGKSNSTETIAEFLNQLQMLPRSSSICKFEVSPR